MELQTFVEKLKVMTFYVQIIQVAIRGQERIEENPIAWMQNHLKKFKKQGALWDFNQTVGVHFDFNLHE